MKRNLIRLITVALVLFTAVSGVYANGNKEEKTNMDFSSLDLTSASTETIINSFEKLQDTYQERENNLIQDIQKAYDKNNADEYFALRKEYADLHLPSLTHEESLKIQENIQVSGDKNLAMWLYKNSPWYRPSITFKASIDGMSFTKTVSVMPGTTLELPYFNTEDSLSFKGWKQDGNSEIYNAGTSVEMPFTDTVYTAVFELSQGFKEGKSLVCESTDFTINTGSVFPVEIKLKNNGTLNLENVELALTTDDPLLYVMSDTLNARSIKSNSLVNARFYVVTKAPAGTSFNALIKATDKDGTLLEEPVTITVN